METLNAIGIYENAICNAIEASERAMEKCGLSGMIDDLHCEAFNYLPDVGDFNDITNSIIYAYFSTAKSFIEIYAKKAYDVEFYTNCDDSHFYINGEGV